MRASPVFPICLALAGCGTTSSDTASTVDVPANAAQSGINFVGASHDATDDEIVINPGGANEVTLTRSGSFGGFQQYLAEDSDGYFLVTDSGGSQAILVATEDLGGGILGFDYGRLATTALPTTGEVEYAGSYIGLLTNVDSTVLNYLVEGTAALTVDFAASDGVSGAITDRTITTFSSLEVATTSDVAFQATGLDANGAFSGSTGAATLTTVFTLSGRAPVITEYSGDGRFEGLISGANADEAVGAVIIDYDEVDGTSAQTETGVFVLESGSP